MHERFQYKNLQEVRKRAEQLRADISFQEDISCLLEQKRVGGRMAPNSMAVLPMEGCDCCEDGTPSELTQRRYQRFASGGAGLLWWEACAVVPEGKANPRQMMITEANIGVFAQMILDANRAAAEKNGESHRPLHILQLTHSGRYSRPEGHKCCPIISQHDPVLDQRSGVLQDQETVSDTYLDELIGRYVDCAVLAQKAGFDGVDIKSCHRYLLNELLASYHRPGRYGGTFKNRSRFLREAIRAIRSWVGPDFIIACRFNVFDAHPYPYGFGCGKEDMWKLDPVEPLALVTMMCGEGIDLLSNSAGNPYGSYPQVTRPFDFSSKGIPIPKEHPLISIERLFGFTRLIQEAAGAVPVVGNGYTWLRQFAPYAGAYNLRHGGCQFVGFGRGSFAYPNAPQDIMTMGKMKPEHCCVTCSKCTEIMRNHGMTGCVIKDSSIYAPLFQQAKQEAAEREKPE